MGFFWGGVKEGLPRLISAERNLTSVISGLSYQNRNDEIYAMKNKRVLFFGKRPRLQTMPGKMVRL